MARVTRIEEERLAALAATSPVFAPGVDNFVAMGGVRGLRDPTATGGLLAGLRSALADSDTRDRRADDGAARGGRRQAGAVRSSILAG